MISIRLSRVGKKKQPSYRVIVIDKHRDPWAKHLEQLGHYNPRTKALTIEKERLTHWLSKGAECSTTLWNIFVTQKLIEGKTRSKTHISVTRKKKLEEAKAKAAA